MPFLQNLIPVKTGLYTFDRIDLYFLPDYEENPMKLKDRVALLTAAAGAGIGQATARVLASEGANVVVTDAHEGRARQVAESIAEEYGIDSVGMACDVTRLDQVEDVVNQTLSRFGRIDVLLNNAGTNRPAQVVDITDDMWDLVMNVSLKGTFYCCRSVLPSMIKQQFGRIINIASTAAFMGLKAGHAHYAAAKAGVMAFSRCLAMEVAEHYITVNTIAPSFIYNEFIPHLYPEEEIRRMEEAIPYARKGTPDDVAQTVLFLATGGEYVTGQTICVTGGSWMR
jgi:3-oxoacyl-[acyl-carrier protein] reductase